MFHNHTKYFCLLLDNSLWWNISTWHDTFSIIRWNQLDIMIVVLSIVGIVMEEMKANVIQMNPTIIRVMRVLRIARGMCQTIISSVQIIWRIKSKKCCFYFFPLPVLKLLKMAKGIRALLDTVIQALPQVGNLGLLFFLLFFIFAALGVELFGRLGLSILLHFFNVSNT